MINEVTTPPGGPGGTPPPTDTPPTGVKPPGWAKLFKYFVEAYLRNPNVDPKSASAPDIIRLCGALADHALSQYPGSLDIAE
jgi:hypothetical protein